MAIIIISRVNHNSGTNWTQRPWDVIILRINRLSRVQTGAHTDVDKRADLVWYWQKKNYALDGSHRSTRSVATYVYSIPHILCLWRRLLPITGLTHLPLLVVPLLLYNCAWAITSAFGVFVIKTDHIRIQLWACSAHDPDSQMQCSSVVWWACEIASRVSSPVSSCVALHWLTSSGRQIHSPCRHPVCVNSKDYNIV